MSECTDCGEPIKLETAEERLEAALDRIDIYWQSHSHSCADCLDDVIEDVHLLLAHGGVPPEAPVDSKLAN